MLPIAWEQRTDFDVAKALASRLGFADQWPENLEALWNDMLKPIDVIFEDLSTREKNWISDDSAYHHERLDAKSSQPVGLGTPSTKVELYPRCLRVSASHQSQLMWRRRTIRYLSLQANHGRYATDLVVDHLPTHQFLGEMIEKQLLNFSTVIRGKINRDHMTHVVTDSCIRCRFTDCFEVCPVDCFKIGESFLVIDPENCIDCGVCIAECPVKAIYAEAVVPAEQSHFIALNVTLSQQWETVSSKQDPLPESGQWRHVTDKLKLIKLPGVEL